MKCVPVVAYKDRLDSLFAQVSMLNSEPKLMGLMGDWAKYLCVLVAGFVETALCEIYCQYAAGRVGDICIRNMIRKRLAEVYNPKAGRIVEVTAWFNEDWAKELESSFQDKHTAAVNGIMMNRNKIAHGDKSDVSYRRVLDWYHDIIEVIDLLERQCGI